MFDAQLFCQELNKALNGSKRKRGKAIGLRFYKVQENGSIVRYHHKPTDKQILQEGKLDCGFLLEMKENGEPLPTFKDLTEEELITYCKKHKDY